MRTGSCLCGAIEFEFSEKPTGFSYCHCTMCQKFHGAAFGPYLRFLKKDFKISKGQEMETVFQSSQWASRSFCSQCGSSLRYISHSEPELVFIAAGILNESPGMDPQRHIFVKDKCSWYEIKDQIPQLERY